MRHHDRSNREVAVIRADRGDRVGKCLRLPTESCQTAVNNLLSSVGTRGGLCQVHPICYAISVAAPGFPVARSPPEHTARRAK